MSLPDDESDCFFNKYIGGKVESGANSVKLNVILIFEDIKTLYMITAIITCT